MFLLTRVTGAWEDTCYDTIFVSNDEQKIKDKIIELKTEDMKRNDICKTLSEFEEQHCDFYDIMKIDSSLFYTLPENEIVKLDTEYDIKRGLLITNFLLEQGIPEEEHPFYSPYDEIPYYRISEVTEI